MSVYTTQCVYIPLQEVSNFHGNAPFFTSASVLVDIGRHIEVRIKRGSFFRAHPGLSGGVSVLSCFDKDIIQGTRVTDLRSCDKWWFLEKVDQIRTKSAVFHVKMCPPYLHSLP